MIKIGVLERMRLMDVLQRVERHMKDGLLIAEAHGQEIELYFQQGLLKSISYKKHTPLGERLVQAGVIAEDHLLEAKLLGATPESQRLASEKQSELLIALTLVQRQRLSREQLNAWLSQEAFQLLRDILTGPEHDVYFDESIQVPSDRFPLNCRVTSLIAAIPDNDNLSRISLIDIISALEEADTLTSITKISQDTQTITSSMHNSVELPSRRYESLPSNMQKSSPSPRSFSSDRTAIEKLATLRMKIFKRDPHPEKLPTISIAALKGITHPKQMKNARLRTIGIVFMAISLCYIFWMLENLNKDALWLSLPFLVANICLSMSIFISIFNNWNRSTPNLFKVPQDLEPSVAVLIPTYGEPIEMLQQTIKSVLNQDWPHKSLYIIVGDDGHNAKVQSLVENLQKEFASAHIIYHQPPSKDRPERRGKAKDGNLNSMLKFIEENYPDIQYIETRDADDLVGDTNFLRYTIGHLVSNPKASYVQTIKEAMVSPGDPFGNLQPIFYRGIMLAKHASNAVFPCGSGLVWRKRHLTKIGGFPTWNLVEDLYSGYVALQHGLRGSYLSIVGAVGQVAPEDIPNVYKQLGTWALDTVRLFVWKNPWFVKGLTFKQRMHFTEMGLYYLSSFANFVFLITPAICLFSGTRPVTSSNALIFMAFLLTYMLIIDLFVWFLGQKVTLQEFWRAKQLNVGMVFVYMKASFLAVMYGGRKKPTYKVTRKVQMVGLYFKEVFFQTLLFLVLLSSIIYNIYLYHDMSENIDLGSTIWALFYMLTLSGMISKSWYGIKFTSASGASSKHLAKTKVVPELRTRKSWQLLHLYTLGAFRYWVSALLFMLLLTSAFLYMPSLTSSPTKVTPTPTPHWISHVNSPTSATPLPYLTLRSLAQTHNIDIGTAVDLPPLQSDSQYGDTLSQQFNSLTPENAMKLMAIEPERNRYSFTDADTIVAFAKANTMQVHGHTLVWGAYSAIPAWLKNGNFSRSTLLAILQDYIHTVVTHYRGQVSTWDVVNEALDADNFWMDKIGPDYIDWAFRWAREADPQAKLLLNDYNSEGSGTKSDQVYDLVQGLLQRGVPVDGVGLEMHLVLGEQLPIPQEVIANMNRLAALGLEVQITEMDAQIHDASGTMQEKLAAQASAYSDMLGACLSATKCTAFVMWGFTDRYSWIPAFTGHPDAPLIFDESYHPKPAYCALVTELAPPSYKSPLC